MLVIDGCSLLPVRMIPFATGWDLSPLRVVMAMIYDEIPGIYLPTYHFTPGDKYHRITHQDLTTYIRELRRLDENSRNLDKSLDDEWSWRAQSIKAMPASTFAWWIELEDLWYERHENPWPGPDDPVLNPEPRIPSALLSVVYEGFEALETHPSNLATLKSSVQPAPMQTDHPVEEPTPTEKSLTNDVEQSEIAPPASSPSSNENRFVWTGDHWTITFNGEMRTFKDSKGLRYIEQLIRNQGEEISVVELQSTVNPTDGDAVDTLLSSMSAEELEATGLVVSHLGEAGEVIDEETIRQCKDKLKSIDDELEITKDTGNVERQAKLVLDKKKIEDYLSAGTSLKGRPRKTPSPIENKRKAVERAITRSRKKIIDTFPDLGHHLKQSLTTGTFCQYTPRPKVDWHLNKK